MTRISHLLLLALSLAVGERCRAEPVTIEAVVLRPSVEVEVPARHTGVLATIAVCLLYTSRCV